MKRARGFTIVELLVSIAVIGILMSILLPAIGKAVDYTRLIKSQANLRQLGQAANTYASEWNGRQFTLTDDNLGRYGNDARGALQNFEQACGYPHPSIEIGWDENRIYYEYPFTGDFLQYTYPMVCPIDFDTAWGWFRMADVTQFNRYLNGRLFDPVFYASKDRIALAEIEELSAAPGEITVSEKGAWPTYVFSPAAMFSPDVFRPTTDGGFQHPFSLDAGLRCPSMSQVRYSDSKTLMAEHRWLQNTRSHCNPAFGPPEWIDEYYGGPAHPCEPYFFNHSWESVPVTLFYDGHVQGLGVREAEAADTRMQGQSGHGLWSRDTPFGNDGYFIPEGYDFAATSFHILTTDGIRGRDKMAK